MLSQPLTQIRIRVFGHQGDKVINAVAVPSPLAGGSFPREMSVTVASGDVSCLFKFPVLSG